MLDLAAVVLAGGAARRLGGVLKPALPVGGRPLILRVLDATTAARPRIVVGPLELVGLLPTGVSVTREHPAGGGPVAGLAAAVRLLPPTPRRVAVLSADLPFLTPEVLCGLSECLDAEADVAVLLDGSGRRQWLCSVWDRMGLACRLAGLAEPTGARMRDLVGDATVREVSASPGAGPPPWFDCDTDEDIRRAEEWLGDGDPG